MPAPARYRCDDLLIDLEAREILRDGRRVDVEAKAFDLIALLLANRERALGKQELNAALWNGRPVTDAALSQQLRKARRALGDDGGTQRAIRTVHGRGLRWVAPVVPLAATAEAGARTVDDTAADDAIAATSTPVAAPAPRAPEPSAPAAAAPRTDARRRRRLVAGAAAAVLLLALAVALRPPFRAAGAPRSAPRVAVLPVVDRTGEADLDWTSSGLM
ncbi:MAG TPA: winged helix-turn-helix domain-containing protein, partial [Dokdonella sp.]